MSIYKGTTPLAGIATPHLDTRNIGQIIQSTMPLSDAGLHLLDGSLLTSGSYSAFITYMASMYVSNPELFTTEADWQASVSAYGICGKFVYDSVNSTVRLPKLYNANRYLIDSGTSNDIWYRIYSDGWCEQGQKKTWASNTGYISTNITFPIEMADSTYTIAIASDYTGDTSGGINYWHNATTTGVTIKTCGYGYSWSIAGYTDVSDYKTNELYQYIVIANSTKTEIEVDIDEVATDLNGKADTDLSNVTNTAGFRKLVEVYNNGTSWYKVYREYNPSDGSYIGLWCEQGGHFSVFASAAAQTVNLLKQYADTNYNLQVSLANTGTAYTSNAGASYWTACNKTASSFELYSWTDARLADKDWRACGYLA